MNREYEEWRLVFDAPANADGLDEVIGDALASACPDVDIHRRDRGDVAVYAYSEPAVREAGTTVERGLDRLGIPFTSELKRWNPGEERWQDPRLPVAPPSRRLGPEWLDLDDLGWEVRLRLDGRRATAELAESLREEGLPTITDGWKRLTVGAADEEAARSLADDLRLRSPFARIDVRPLSRWRRWLIRHGLVGGYADGGGAIDAGGGGNGGGGA
jgi:hypothetical protein